MRRHERVLLPATAATIGALLLAVGCGSSATTSTAPSPISRCAITLDAGETTLPASGGAGAVGVTATRDCSWSASVDGTWISLKSGTSGQGQGTVEFTAAPNPDPQARSGAVVVNGSRAQVTQSAAECVITLAGSSADFPPAGGTGHADVRASSQLCTWTATSDSGWIEITAGANGKGTASVTFSVAPTAGPPRAGSLTIAGQRFSVTQSQGCTYSVDRTTYSAGASGGSGTVAVTTAAACPWEAASNAPWLTVLPPAGSGPGHVTFSVAPTQGPERTATAVIAGQLFTVTQSPGCSYQVQPTSQTVGASGGTSPVSINTGAGCSWTAQSNAPWITIQGAASGNGPGGVVLSIAPTTGGARTGTATVAGQQITISQTQGCTFAIAPQSQSVPASGGTGKVTVTAGEGCSWTAASSASWLTIVSASSGSGNGEVQFSAAATSGPARSATLTIAGYTFTVTQGQGCTYTLSPQSYTAPAAGGSTSVNVTTGAECGWTAASNAPWIAIVSPPQGAGNGSVQLSIEANAGPPRSGTVTVAGQTFTVSQESGCEFMVTPDRVSSPAGGGPARVDVTTSSSCAWTAVSNAAWITVTAGASGTGNGSVDLSVAANTGPARSGTVTVAGRTVTVAQDSGCTILLTPGDRTLGSPGGSGSVTVTAGAGCSWTATSSVAWIVVTSGASGAGDGVVQYTVEANATGSARSGTIVIGGQTFTVNQQASNDRGLDLLSATLPLRQEEALVAAR